MSDYCVVSADKLVDLELKVKGYIFMGWVPSGGVSSDSPWYSQALVRTGKDMAKVKPTGKGWDKWKCETCDDEIDLDAIIQSQKPRDLPIGVVSAIMLSFAEAHEKCVKKKDENA
jgi:hypothetical protein